MSAKRWRMRYKFRGFVIKEVWRVQLLENGFSVSANATEGLMRCQVRVLSVGASRARAFARSRS